MAATLCWYVRAANTDHRLILFGGAPAAKSSTSQNWTVGGSSSRRRANGIAGPGIAAMQCITQGRVTGKERVHDGSLFCQASEPIASAERVQPPRHAAISFSSFRPCYTFIFDELVTVPRSTCHPIPIASPCQTPSELGARSSPPPLQPHCLSTNSLADRVFSTSRCLVARSTRHQGIRPTSDALHSLTNGLNP